MQHRERMRWTPWNPKIDRDLGRYATRDLRAPAERAPAQGTGAHGDDEARRGYGCVRALQRLTHVHVHRPRDDNSIGVSWRRYDLNAKPRHVEDNVASRHELALASVAASGHDRPKPERASEQ